MAWTVILNPNRDYPSDSLSIQIKQICIGIVFLTVHFMGINVNLDQNRLGYSGVDMDIKAQLPVRILRAAHAAHVPASS